jgi:uncharacterized protein (TIGR02231 family)
MPSEQTVALVNLPTQVQEETVRVSGRGAGIKILGVEVKTAYLTAAPETELAAMRAQLEALRRQDHDLEDEEHRRQTRLDTLYATKQTYADTLGRMIAYKRATSDDFLAFARFITDEEAALMTQRRDLATQRRDKQLEITALEQQINQRQKPQQGAEHRREIHVRLNAAQETEFELEVRYNIAHASWTPLYDVRLSEDGEVELTYLAQILQRTGEDWHNVQLALSTARPTVSATLPELRPQYIQQYIQPPKPLPAKDHRLTAQAAMPAASKGGVGDNLLPSETSETLRNFRTKSEVAVAEVEPDLGSAITFKISAPFTAPADGTPHKTTVTIEKLGSALDYWIVPKLAPEAYLRAKILNTSAYVLLPGTASIYHGDMFVGKTNLRTIAPNEEFEVQLGSDDRIRVKRELIQRDVNKRFIGGARQMTYKYKVTLTNLLPNNANLLLHDQIPQSANEQIKVKLIEATPAVTEQTQLNLLKWELTLKPNEKREVIFAFQVEHPAEMQVVGLE